MFRIAAPLIKKSHTAAISMRLTFALALGCLTSRTLASLVAPALHRPALLQRPRVAAASVRCAEGDDDKSIVERLGLPVNLISEKSNPYVTSKADRMREKFGEKSVVGQSARSGGRAGVEDRLSEDIARFKAERGPDPSALTADEEPGFLMKTIDTLGTILTFNFGIICLFFTWFLVRPPADGPADALGREGRAADALGVCVRRLRGVRGVSTGRQRGASGDAPPRKPPCTLAAGPPRCRPRSPLHTTNSVLSGGRRRSVWCGQRDDHQRLPLVLGLPHPAAPVHAHGAHLPQVNPYPYPYT